MRSINYKEQQDPTIFDRLNENLAKTQRDILEHNKVGVRHICTIKS